MQVSTTIALIMVAAATVACGEFGLVTHPTDTEDDDVTEPAKKRHTGSVSSSSHATDVADASTYAPEDAGTIVPLDASRPPAPNTGDPALNRGIYFCTVACVAECKVDCSSASNSDELSPPCAQCMTAHLPECDDQGNCGAR